MFKIGDVVRIKSLDEIKKTFNGPHRTHGCNFLKNMEEIVGTVHKVTNVFDESVHTRYMIEGGLLCYRMHEWLEPYIEPEEELITIGDCICGKKHTKLIKLQGIPVCISCVKKLFNT